MDSDIKEYCEKCDSTEQWYVSSMDAKFHVVYINTRTDNMRMNVIHRALIVALHREHDESVSPLPIHRNGGIQINTEIMRKHPFRLRSINGCVWKRSVEREREIIDLKVARKVTMCVLQLHHKSRRMINCMFGGRRQRSHNINTAAGTKETREEKKCEMSEEAPSYFCATFSFQ